MKHFTFSNYVRGLRCLTVAMLCTLAVLTVIGCSATATPDYVAADRKTFDAIAPTVRGILDGSLPLADIDADERATINLTLDTWEIRLRAAEPQPAAISPSSQP